MTDAYRDILTRFANGQLMHNQPVYDYTGDRLEQIYDQFFIAMNEHLQQRAQTLGWPAPVLLFVDRPTVNAFAAPTSDPKKIGLNRGLIETMHDLFEGQQAVFNNPVFDGIRQQLAGTGVAPYMTMLQFVLAFCYQHEYTHLLQVTPGAPPRFEESTVGHPRPADVPLLHALEMDADHMAAHRVAWMLTGHFMDPANGGGIGSREQLTQLAAGALAGIFCLLVHFAQGYPALYYGERDHPHPLVRIAFIAQYLPEIVNANVPPELAINHQEALTQALALAEQLLIPQYGDAVRGLGQTLLANSADITAYGNRIIDLALGIPGLSHGIPVAHF